MLRLFAHIQYKVIALLHCTEDTKIDHRILAVDGIDCAVYSIPIVDLHRTGVGIRFPHSFPLRRRGGVIQHGDFVIGRCGSPEGDGEILPVIAVAAEQMGRRRGLLLQQGNGEVVFTVDSGQAVDREAIHQQTLTAGIYREINRGRKKGEFLPVVRVDQTVQNRAQLGPCDILVGIKGAVSV